MIEIVRKIGIKKRNPVTFKVYTKDEADQLGLVYKYWKDLRPEDGIKYGLSDDGYVGDVLRVMEYKERRGSKTTNIYVKLSFATNFVRRKNHIRFLERQATNSWSYTKAQHWMEFFLSRNKTKQIARACAHMFLNGKYDYERIGKMLRADDPKPFIGGRKFLRNTKVKEMIMSEVEQVLNQKGLNKGFLAESAKAMIDMAIQRENLKDGAKLIELVGKWLAMEPVKTTTTETKEENVLMLQTIANQIQAVKAERKTISERSNTEDRELNPAGSGLIEADRECYVQPGNDSNPGELSTTEATVIRDSETKEQQSSTN